MQDLQRFQTLHELTELGIDDPLDDASVSQMSIHLDTLEERFIALRAMVFRCLASGWNDQDLLEIREWILDQGNPTTLDQAAIAVINDFLAPAAFNPVPGTITFTGVPTAGYGTP